MPASRAWSCYIVFAHFFFKSQHQHLLLNLLLVGIHLVPGNLYEGLSECFYYCCSCWTLIQVGSTEEISNCCWYSLLFFTLWVFWSNSFLRVLLKYSQTADGRILSWHSGKRLGFKSWIPSQDAGKVAKLTKKSYSGLLPRKWTKWNADVRSSCVRGARMYPRPETACDLRFITFFQIHPIYNDGGPFWTKDLGGLGFPNFFVNLFESQTELLSTVFSLGQQYYMCVLVVGSGGTL